MTSHPSDAVLSPFAPHAMKGRNVVLTGAGRGIGAAAAVAFLKMGARVFAHTGRAESAAQHTLARGLDTDEIQRLKTASADFARLDEVEAFAEEVAAHLPRVDVLVNNAGSMIDRIPLASVSEGAVKDILNINTVSIVMLTQRLLPLMSQQGNASIINTTSVAARAGGSTGGGIYAASKGFVSTLTRCQAREFAPLGIRANAVAPGTIETDFHRRHSTPERLKQVAAALPLQRLGTAQDCVGAFVFLALPELSGYVTGQVLEVNGGQLMP